MKDTWSTPTTNHPSKFAGAHPHSLEVRKNMGRVSRAEPRRGEAVLSAGTRVRLSSHVRADKMRFCWHPMWARVNEKTPAGASWLHSPPLSITIHELLLPWSPHFIPAGFPGSLHPAEEQPSQIFKRDTIEITFQKHPTALYTRNSHCEQLSL